MAQAKADRQQPCSSSVRRTSGSVASCSAGPGKLTVDGETPDAHTEKLGSCRLF